MKRQFRKADIAAVAFLCLSVILLLGTLTFGTRPGDTDNMARRVERRLSSRIELLDRYSQAIPEDLPEDMVVYRYENDSLKEWHNQFPLHNDDISGRMVIQRITNPRANMTSPLAVAGPSYEMMNLGNRWYLVKAVKAGSFCTISGLEIISQDVEGEDVSVNPCLHLPSAYSISPLGSTCGSPVCVDGEPVFKIQFETLKARALANAFTIWLAFAFMIAASFCFIRGRRTLRRFAIGSAVQIVAALLMYAWGRLFQGDLPVFSPVLFAGGPVLFSLGAVLLVNIAILTITTGLYMVRQDVYRRVRSFAGSLAGLVAVLLSIVGILTYMHFSLSSIIINSNISMELYKFGSISIWTAVVYTSYMFTLISVPLLLQIAQASFSRMMGRHLRVFSVTGRLVMAILTATYLVSMTSAMGFHKERRYASMMSNRLSVDRDITLELQLRRAEGAIAQDPFIGPLASFSNGAALVRNRIMDTYFSRLAQDYNVDVYVLGNISESPQQRAFLDDRLSGASAISEDSHFAYVQALGGRFRYDGTFFYYLENEGMITLLVEVEPKSGASSHGYAAIMGINRPGSVSLPGFYSYARYNGADLQTFNGSFPYPTTLTPDIYPSFYSQSSSVLRKDGYIHFINKVADDECVVMSRSVHGAANYLISVVLIALIAFLLYSLPVVRLRLRRRNPSENYFSTRMTWVVEVSLVLTLVAMAMVSVTFVTRRNEANAQAIMTDKLSSIQAMVQNGIKGINTTDDLRTQGIMALLTEVSANTGADLSLFDPDGLIIMSTMPDVYDRMLMGCRLDEHAYNQIIRGHKRYYIHSTSNGHVRFYCMDAPIRSDDGRVIGILSCPYIGGQTIGMQRDAIIHTLTMLTLFILLLLVSRVIAKGIVSRLFKPLHEMGAKMDNADLYSLEYIHYDRNDEISSLVQAYNGMVTELQENSRKLAAVERDKAWSGMARQVAHEIKNPLTPMKLQLQRLIRLKQKGDPSWQDKFDEGAQILLEHINILTDIANEFSTFAKLYGEEAVPIELDHLLQTEMEMFNNKDNISFEYLGLDGVVVSGPKPQLTRVFDNLINNAVQAVGEREDGHVRVSLRNSLTDGYYDILVEDDGPGVSEENVDKLFTPNFTTKSGGTGLGLAISRSVVERCGATISYSKSFALGGACFTIRYPKS